jgi:hypothetical protein
MALIDPNLSPADAAVALRSLDRRYRAALAGREDDESPDDLALRPGPDGWSALGHVVAAARAIAACAAALDEVQREELAEVDRSVVEADRRPVDPTPTGTVDERVSELAWEADALADRIKRVPADRWGRSGRISGTGRAVGSLDLVRAAVEAGVTHLRSAEQTLEAARRQR